MRRVILISALALCGGGCFMAPPGPTVSHEVKTYDPQTGHLVRVERWKDKSGLRALYVLMDPSGQNVNAWHTNQAALGGCSHFSAGSAGVVVDTNSAAIIGESGTAVGNVIGAAAKTAVK